MGKRQLIVDPHALQRLRQADPNLAYGVLEAAVVKASLADMDDPYSGVQPFIKGGPFSPDPVDLDGHSEFLTSIQRLLRPTETVERSIAAVLLSYFLSISEDFYGPGEGNYASQGRPGRLQMKNQLKACQDSMSALEVVYHDNNTPDGANARVSEKGFDEHSTRHELESLIELIRSPACKKPGSYEIVYVQSPGDLVSDEGREDIVTNELIQELVEGLRAHETYFATNAAVRRDISAADYEHLFEGDVSYRKTYDLCRQFLADKQDLLPETRRHLEGFTARTDFMACSQEKDPRAEEFLNGLVAQVLPALPTEEQYVNTLARNVAQTGGVLILEGFQQEQVEGFELLQDDKGVRLYTRIVEQTRE